MSSFTETLVVSPLPDGKTWVVMECFSYAIGDLETGRKIKVVPGFMTDFASIPRVFWGILPKWGKYGNAAVVHDWNYWMQELNGVTRKEADDIMKEGMEVLGVKKWKQFFIYSAVRWFGWAAWKRNQWDRKAGYIRIRQDIVVKPIKSTEAFNERPGIMQRAMEQVMTGQESNEEKPEEELEAAGA